MTEKDLSRVESHSPHNSLERGSKSACFPSPQGIVFGKKHSRSAGGIFLLMKISLSETFLGNTGKLSEKQASKQTNQNLFIALPKKNGQFYYYF